MISNMFFGNKTIKFCIFYLLSAISSIATIYYLDNTSGFITLFLWLVFFKVYTLCPRLESKRFYVYNGAFSFLFTLCMAIGKTLDFNLPVSERALFLLNIGLFMAVFPVVSIMSKKLEVYRTEGTDNKFFRQACYLFIVFSWVAGYLAVFPGIYSNDAHHWYRNFDDPMRSVSSQWSPVYAGVFYMFVHTGKVLYNNYECGLALFIAIQSIFILFGIWNILTFVQEQAGNRACILTTLFFGVVPTHMLMAMQTAQGAPFMVCFAMCIIHLYRMVDERSSYWGSYRNSVAFILWGISACILRNNAYYVFVLFLLCIPFYYKELRIKLFFTVATIIFLITIYNGPVLDSAGISKGTTLQESLSMPLQQMACAYVQYPHKIAEKQKKLLEKYIPAKVLKQYLRDPEISDVQKRNLNVKLVRNNIHDFIRLYINIGLKAPVAYLKAAYMQDMGLLYIDKRYQDTRMWHNLIEFISYDLRNPVYIKIERSSLFPLYDAFLGKLFGERINKNIAYYGYAGHTESMFSSIPLLNILCRPSTYFWCLIYFLFVAAYKKHKEAFVYLGMAVCFTLSVLLGPVILYRYYAPVIFSFPVLIAALFGMKKKSYDIE